MFKLLSPTLLFALIATLIQSASGQILKLTPLSGFGTNGNGAFYPKERDYLDSGGQLQRGMAWNPVTGHLLLACRTNAASPTIFRVLILDGVTGETNDIYPNLDMGGLSSGGNPSFLLSLIGVADDGAIYGANVSNAQVPSEFRLYRWDSESGSMSFPPVWYGDPSGGIRPDVNRRWGDTLAVRGSGMSTEVLVASRGSNVVVFTPSDPGMSTFVPHYIQTDVPAGALGYGIAFGAGNTFYGTAGAFSGGPLYHLSYDINAGTASTIEIFYGTNFSPTVSPIAFNVQSNWLAGIETRAGADYLKIYRHDPSATPPGNQPILQDRWTWITNFNNNNFAGSVCFTTNGTIYALDSDNGIMAFTVSEVSSNTLPPSVTLQPQSSVKVIGSSINFNALADGEPPLSYQWQYKAATNTAATVDIPGATSTSYSLSNLQISNSGAYTFIVSNAYGMQTSSVASLTVASAPQAFYEPFDYGLGSLIAGQTAPNGQLWVPTTGAGGAISNGNLTYPGLPAPKGNSFGWGGSTISERIPTGTNVSGPLYFSFLLRIDSIAGSYTSDTIAGFADSTNGTVFDPKINVQSNSPGFYQLGAYKGGGTSLGQLATNYSGQPIIHAVGDTVFVVGNYNFINDANNDTVNMWINPDPSTFGADTPPPPNAGPIGAASGTDMTQLSCFFWRSTMGTLRKVADELRVGYSWAEVTPLVAPTLSVSTSGTNTVVSWPSFYQALYTLQGSANVVTGPWASVPNPVVVNGANNTVTIPSTNTFRFFRLLKS